MFVAQRVARRLLRDVFIASPGPVYTGGDATKTLHATLQRYRCDVAATLQQCCVVGLSTHQRNFGVETRFLGIIACNVAARNLHVGLTCNVACNYSKKSSSRLRAFFDVSRVRPRNAAATLLQRCSEITAISLQRCMQRFRCIASRVCNWSNGDRAMKTSAQQTSRNKRCTTCCATNITV